MSFLNKYPYTDFHELNLDWFLAEFQNVTTKVEDLDTTVQQFTAFVTNYFDDLDVQQEINNKLDQMVADGTLAALIQPLFDTYKAEVDGVIDDQNAAIRLQNENINVLVSRMDEFASLPPGSTAGNAELLDIRVEANGKTAASAGDAVRDQILPSMQTDNLFNINGNNETTGYYNRTNVFVTDANLRSTDYIPVLAGSYYKSNLAAAAFILWYNINKNFVSHTEAPAGSTIQAPSGICFARFIYLEAEKTSFNVCMVLGVSSISEALNNVGSNGMIEDDVNLFDLSANNTTTGYYDRTNTLVSDVDLRSTDYIPVLKGCKYTTSLAASTFVLWYDADKNFIGFEYITPPNAIEAPDGICFARFIFQESTKASFVINFRKCIRDLSGEIVRKNTENDAHFDYIDNALANLDVSSQWSGKTGVAFGTSLTYRALTTGGYLNYLPSFAGMTIENQGLGSGTILQSGGLPNMLDSVKAYNNYMANDLVILEGFVNDWYYNNTRLGTYKDDGELTVCGCVKSAIKHILQQNAAATVIVVIDYTGSGITDADAVPAGGSYRQIDFYDEIAKACEYLSIPVLRCDKESNINRYTQQYLIDNIHPSLIGAKQMASYIWSKMKQIFPKVTA